MADQERESIDPIDYYLQVVGGLVARLSRAANDVPLPPGASLMLEPRPESEKAALMEYMIGLELRWQAIDALAGIAKLVRNDNDRGTVLRLIAELRLGSVQMSKAKADEMLELLIGVDAAVCGLKLEAGGCGKELRFPRTPDCSQRCLDALENAPHGIPTHQAIADEIGMEVSTVKEAMPKLKTAEFVEKNGDPSAWRITDKGKEHLRMLQGR